MSPRALLAEQRARAEALLPPDVLTYLEAGADDEVSAGEAESAWRAYRLRPRVLTDVTAVDPSSEVLGTPLATPLLVAPTAFHRLAHPEGEVATARGAAQAGALMTVSTRCSVPLEDVAAAAGGPWWFQVYATRDPAVHRALALRARDAGATALVLTGDTPVVGRKPRLDAVRIPDVEAFWTVNAAPHLSAGATSEQADEALEQSPSATADLFGELAALTGLPVLVKGVLRGDEAVRCVDAGAAGVVVSNHGGRQLDRAVSSAHALPDVVAALDGRAPVLVDGGIRSGLDVLTALALGASAVLVGRPVLWALTAGGSDGVSALLGALGDELRHAMALAGAPTFSDVTRDLVTGASTAWEEGGRVGEV
ncbi:alpha-hydroxy acid oxidase [Angustibacter peucedani]